MTMIDFDFWQSIKGFMSEPEARRLFDTAKKASQMGPLLEIGSYCGKSAYIIGCACRETGSVLFSIDHHSGSEEQQPDQEYFDPELFDKALKRINTLPFFLQTIVTAGLENIVIPVVSDSVTAGKFWQTPLAMVFIDGGHAFDTVLSDYETWADQIIPGGYLVFHDIFLDPQKGGQAPRQVYDTAVRSEKWQVLEMTETLGVLIKK